MDRPGEIISPFEFGPLGDAHVALEAMPSRSPVSYWPQRSIRWVRERVDIAGRQGYECIHLISLLTSACLPAPSSVRHDQEVLRSLGIASGSLDAQPFSKSSDSDLPRVVSPFCHLDVHARFWLCWCDRAYGADCAQWQHIGEVVLAGPINVPAPSFTAPCAPEKHVLKVTGVPATVELGEVGNREGLELTCNMKKVSCRGSVTVTS